MFIVGTVALCFAKVKQNQNTEMVINFTLKYFFVRKYSTQSYIKQIINRFDTQLFTTLKLKK